MNNQHVILNHTANLTPSGEIQRTQIHSNPLLSTERARLEIKKRSTIRNQRPMGMVAITVKTTVAASGTNKHRGGFTYSFTSRCHECSNKR